MPPGGLRTLLWERGRGPSLGSWLSRVGVGSGLTLSAAWAGASPGAELAAAVGSGWGSSPSHMNEWSLGLFG